MLITTPSRSFGNMSANIEYAAGDSPASPNPTPMRVKISDQKLRTRLQQPVKKLHNSTETPIRFRRLRVSAILPNGNGSLSERVEQRKGQAGKQPDLRVADPEILLDGPDKQAQNLTVDERERVTGRQDNDGVPRKTGTRLSPTRREEAEAVDGLHPESLSRFRRHWPGR